jgi:hypothetical protein
MTLPSVSPVSHVGPEFENCVVEAWENSAVDEANKEYGEPLNQTGVVVELAFCEKLESWVKG